jgi:pyruvate dehydrogenase E2 component (dihydrolipoamide acetyltransferase)
MPLFEFKLPDLGEGVAEGEVVAWHVETGQDVREDQEMVEVMTDKATVTIGAPHTGRVTELCVAVGERVPVGRVLVVIDTDATRGSGQARESEARASATPVPRIAEAEAPRAVRSSNGESKAVGIAASAVGDIRESLPGMGFLSRAAASVNGVPSLRPVSPPSAATPIGQPLRTWTTKAAQPESPVAAAHASRARSSSFDNAPAIAGRSAADDAYEAGAFYAAKPLATPATRKLARDLGVDLRTVPPTGPNGRVTKDDVRGCNGEERERQARVSPPAQHDEPFAREERRPFVGLRRRIAERMQLSVQKAAHFTFVEEVEVDALKRLVESLKPTGEKLGVKLHYLPFIVKAVTLALKKHAALNSMLDEASNELVYRRYYHIGIATATEQGLLVPVVRDADRKSPLEIASDIQRLSSAARAGKLSSAELSGSTFTITSLGRMGGLLATPVLNYPEVGILGVHAVKERPVVRNGQIVVGNVMLLSLSFDHRIIDGHVGAAFAYEVINYLEHPELLLIELA